MDALAPDEIRLGDRPLAVFDVDDVVLQFIAPFEAYLASCNLSLLPRSFRLQGNIVAAGSDLPLEERAVKDTILRFFETQEQWQIPVIEAVEVLSSLSRSADIVFLTAMPPRYRDARRRLLDSFGLPFPLIATEEPKGPVVAQLHAGRPLPLSFADDMVRNLQSVSEHVPQSLLLHIVPESPIHRHAPPAPQGLAHACNWREAGHLISTHFASSS